MYISSIFFYLIDYHIITVIGTNEIKHNILYHKISLSYNKCNCMPLTFCHY